MTHIPDHIIKKIADPDERAKHITWDDAVRRDQHRSEIKLHANFSGFLKRHEDKIALVHHTNPARPSRSTIGEPDFMIAFMNGKTVYVEFKVGANKLSPEQSEIIARLLGGYHEVLVTGSYEEAIAFVQQHWG